VNYSMADTLPERRSVEENRSADRRVVEMPARLTWKDGRGITRFASVVARNVSQFGVYVECPSPVSIPLYRLVQLQIERGGSDPSSLPAVLRQGRVLSAVYRVSPPSKLRPQGLGLRMMVDPRRAAPVQQVHVSAQSATCA
jgi:hypothetical protein